MSDLEVLWKINYGMYIVSSGNKKKMNGQIANAVFQVTSKPPRIAVCINKENLTHKLIERNKIFSVTILSKNTPSTIIGKFGFRSGRDVDKFKDTDYKIGITGVPIVLESAIGYLEAKLLKDMDVGTHTLFVGEVVRGEIIKDEEPMTYSFYHEVKGGKSPKTAPTYMGEQK